MQAVQVSWVGKTCAVARCSISREKKPCNRRTKEERRTMVKSFIKNYRSLNNGKFPSLTLTLKEVGGSFYTVREIVRELIQENKVLGPGNSTSKALNLEYCLEEHAEESFSMDISDHLSISTITHAIGRSQEENYSLSNAQRRVSEEGNSLVKSVTQETFVSHPNDISLTQVMHGELDHEENFSSGKLSGKIDGNSGMYEQIYAEAQVSSSEHRGTHMVERPIPLCEAVSITSPLGEFLVNGDDASNKKHNVARETDFSASSSSVSEIVGSDSLPEANISLNSASSNVSDQGNLYSYDREDFPLASSAAETCNPDSSHETEGVPISLEVSKTSNSAKEVVAAFMPLGNDSVINKTEPTEIHPSTVIAEGSAKSLTNPVSRSLGSRATAATRFELQPELHSKDLESVITNIKSASGESLQPSAKGTAYLEVEAEHEHIVSNTGSASNSSSTSSGKTNEESETSEINPIWAAIKSLLTAVVKFWTE